MTQESSPSQNVQLNQSHKPEGVIQYQLEYQLDHQLVFDGLVELNSWRSYLYRLGLIGQDKHRYDGLGYGNISQRFSPNDSRFVVSGTQTGHLPLLCKEHYVVVERAELDNNKILAHGPIKPSSEALTHAAIYQAKDGVLVVMHVHCPLLWNNAAALALPVTGREIPYGTPAMARAVIACVQSNAVRSGLIAMLGHEDGIIAYADTVTNAGNILLEALMRVHELDHQR